MNATIQTRPGKPGTIVSGPMAERLFRRLKEHGFNDSNDHRQPDDGFEVIQQGRSRCLLLRTATAGVDGGTFSVDLLTQHNVPADLVAISALANGTSGIGILEAHLTAPDSSPLSLLALAYPGKQHRDTGLERLSRYEATLDLTSIVARLVGASVSNEVVGEIATNVAGVLSKFRALADGIRSRQDALDLPFAMLRLVQHLHSPHDHGDGLYDLVEGMVDTLREQNLRQVRDDLSAGKYPAITDAAAYIADKPNRDQ